MFGKKRAAADRHRRDASSATQDSRSDVPAPASPLQMTFDFELQPPLIPDDWRSSGDTPRPQTSYEQMDHSRKSSVGTMSSVLPEALGMSSRHESLRTDKAIQVPRSGLTQQESEHFLGTAGKNAFRPQYVGKVPSFSRPSYFKGSGNFEAQKSLGDSHSLNGNIPASPQKSSDAVESLQSSFDQRLSRLDRPSIAQSDLIRRGSADGAVLDPPTRPFAALSKLASYSTPDLSSTLRSSRPDDDYRAELFNSNQTASPPPFTHKSSKLQGYSKYLSGISHPQSYERPMLRLHTRTSSSYRLNDSTSQNTIGTPYENTSPTFPAPRPVATRPKLGRKSVTLAGVTVPSHHSSASSSQLEALKPEKGEKRKTRLLSPFALLTRRRTTQNEESLSKERAAQEQALARQKDVAAVGVSKLPEGFDPRIKGKLVHDFSAPRPTKRNLSYGGLDARTNDSPSSLGSAPIIFAHIDTESFSVTAPSPSPEPPRRTSHVPVFMEHLAENPDHARRVSSIHAEHLENKDFLQRASFVSSVSALSQESYALPPFARRSNQSEAGRVSVISDKDTRQSPEQATEKERSSAASSYGLNSLPARFSAAQSSDGRQSAASHVSLSNTGMSSQPPWEDAGRIPSVDLASKQEIANLAVQVDSGFLNHATSGHHEDERELSSQTFSDRSSSLPPVAPRSPLRLSAQKDSSDVQHRLRVPDDTVLDMMQPASASTDATLLLPNLKEGTSSTLPSPSVDSPQDTPEIKTAEFVAAPIKGQPTTHVRLVEKRPSAVGHSKRVSRAIRHRVSNASRFSFQFGGSAAEERALEEKHHRMASVAGISKQSNPLASGDDDDEDYFDEDAMDDLDEMEIQAANNIDFDSFNTNSISMPSAPPSMSQARAQLQADSDSDSDYHEGGIYGIEKYNGNNHFNVRSTTPPRQNTDDARSRATFRWQPQGAKSPSQNIPSPFTYAALPAQTRDGSEPTTKAVQKLEETFAAHDLGTADGHDGAHAGDSQPNSQNSEHTAGESHNAAESQHISNGFDLDTDSNLSGFKFVDTPASTRPQSAQVDSLAFARGGLIQQTNLSFTEDAEDDMYFDDGGADFDVNDQDFGETMDEDKFDDDSFLARRPAESLQEVPKSSGPVTSHNEDAFEFSSDNRPHQPFSIPQYDGAFSSFPIPSSDGPYPSFPQTNPARTKQRAQMLLGDLPLQGTLIDSQLAPYHPLSGEASQRDRSNHIPHFLTPGKNIPAVQSASASLNAYHAALASAANRAAQEGRFQRTPSTSTTKSASAYSLSIRNEDRTIMSKENLSFQFKEEAGGPEPRDNINGIMSGRTVNSHVYGADKHSPSKSSFDFGFGENQSIVPQDSFGAGADGINNYDNDDDYDFDDADMIAAANSEALASDDDGFYGQEFGFYAKARPNANGALEAVNGGFFGEDGDDGLTRNRSIKEPNLTPITERSEFSARNSFIGSLTLPGASPHPRLSVSTLFEGEVTSFEELRKLRANAFGGSNASISSDGTRGSPRLASALITSSLPTTSEATASSYNNVISSSNNQPIISSAAPPVPPRSRDGPAPASHLQSNDLDAMPRKTLPLQSTGKPVVGHNKTHSSGVTVPRIQTYTSHSRMSSGGGDSVTYVSEQENGRQRWVMERRRPSEHGQMELVGREVVQGGWI